MSRNQIIKAIEKLPTLTNFGVGLFNDGRSLCASEYKKQFQKERDNLLNSTGAFIKACNWLDRIDKIRSINNKYTSYDLKHIAERNIGYITNGVFIAAAIHCGFNFNVHKNGPNVTFNMSERSIKRYAQDT